MWRINNTTSWMRVMQGTASAKPSPFCWSGPDYFFTGQIQHYFVAALCSQGKLLHQNIWTAFAWNEKQFTPLCSLYAYTTLTDAYPSDKYIQKIERFTTQCATKRLRWRGHFRSVSRRKVDIPSKSTCTCSLHWGNVSTFTFSRRDVWLFKLLEFFRR